MEQSTTNGHENKQTNKQTNNNNNKTTNTSNSIQIIFVAIQKVTVMTSITLPIGLLPQEMQS